MSHLNLKVVRNHLGRCNNIDPQICELISMLIHVLLKISYALKLQDKHNASCFTNILWMGLNLSDGKVT